MMLQRLVQWDPMRGPDPAPSQSRICCRGSFLLDQREQPPTQPDEGSCQLTSRTLRSRAEASMKGQGREGGREGARESSPEELTPLDLEGESQHTEKGNHVFFFSL